MADDLPRRKVLRQLLKPFPLLRRKHLNDPIASGSADVFDRMVQILVVLPAFGQERLQPVDLLRRDTPRPFQFIVGELGFSASPVDSPTMQLFVETRPHADSASHRAGEKDQNQRR